MCRILKKILPIIGYTLFFCGYFYILFVNLTYSFSATIAAEAHSSSLKAVLVSFTIAVMLPGIICFQHHRIGKLEKRLRESDDII